ncbi:TolC family outer membrane protein [uncultured Acinetobacter sp.]|uniref:multidrug efflux outer membrane protein AbuO n=1 Tax=uncultured Acinetobacter sp. TaxID=165433 RepID=UPI002625F862|nr:TolC family outer membrane protein [uncultured Acinetobacter sp.]
MKKQLLFVAGLMITAPCSYALDLVTAYQLAQKNDPTWQANQLQYQVDQLNLGLAQGNLLPTVSVNANITRKNQATNSKQAINIPGLENTNLLPSSSTQRQASVTARQPLFRWDAWQGLKQVKTSLSLSEINLSLQQQQQILNTAQAYFNVLRQQSLTQVYVEEEKALLEQLNMMQAKLRQGLVARSDVSEADAQYQNARANRIAGHVQVLLAQEQLEQMIGPYRENLAVLRADFDYQKPYPNNIQAWQDLAQSHNLSLQQARLQQQYAQDAKRVEQAARLPQVEAVASYGYNQQRPSSAIANDGQFDQVGVEVNWNAFNGGRTKINIEKAQLSIEKAIAEVDAASRQANTEVRKAYMQVETDQAKLKARLAAMQSAQHVSVASQAQYREGLKNMVDVLLAQRNAFVAKQEYVNSQYDYLMHVLNLKAAVGQLTEQDLIELNAWLIQK